MDLPAPAAAYLPAGLDGVPVVRARSGAAVKWGVNTTEPPGITVSVSTVTSRVDSGVTPTVIGTDSLAPPTLMLVAGELAEQNSPVA